MVQDPLWDCYLSIIVRDKYFIFVTRLNIGFNRLSLPFVCFGPLNINLHRSRIVFEEIAIRNRETFPVDDRYIFVRFDIPISCLGKSDLFLE